MVYGERINELLEHTDVDATPDVDYYNHADKLDSVMVMTESDGDQAESYRYKEFGEQTVVDSSFAKLSVYASNIGNWKRYTGQEHALPSSFGDPWYFYRARVYRADAGRFVQRDQLEYRDGANMYSYAMLAPLEHVDPAGLSVLPGPSFSGLPGFARPQFQSTQSGGGWYPAPGNAAGPPASSGSGPSSGSGNFLGPIHKDWYFQCPTFSCFAETCDCKKINEDVLFTVRGDLSCTYTKLCSTWQKVQCGGNLDLSLGPSYNQNCNCIQSDHCTYKVVCNDSHYNKVIKCNMCQGPGMMGGVVTEDPNNCHK